jgi:hypothetical protein
MSLEGDCREAEVPPNFELLITVCVSFDGVGYGLYICIIATQTHIQHGGS